MAVIADRLTKKVLEDYPQRDIDAWVAVALGEYLHSASAEDAIAITRELSMHSFGKQSVVAQEVRSFAEHSQDLTTEQRTELKSLADGLAE